MIRNHVCEMINEVENLGNLYDIITDELRLKYVVENGGWLTEFDNKDNCSDKCKGWRGINRRCECGNRRMSWGDEYDDGVDIDWNEEYSYNTSYYAW